jgi:hypothetical protein
MKSTLKRKKKSPLKIAKDKAWATFSEWVRRSSNGVCYTCGDVKDWKTECNAGHYKHNVLDFDEMNVHNQCIRCNHHLSGNGTEYALHLLRDYGQEALEDLHNRSKQALAGEKRSVEDFDAITEKYKQKIAQL